ncbi:beta/gamma crystallin-related protein [Streptomyces bottropensis]|uniref:beta/gamma crystallin-related protein n=1 Tax=Streptomyces bottropensis TaxID=42235 RepID=UPI00369595D5
MAHSTGITRIGHLGEAFQQSGHFFRRDLWLLAKLVKGRRGSAMMLRQARSSRQVTGRRELHDLGSRACSALPDRPTWRTVMNRTPGDYAEALDTYLVRKTTDVAEQTPAANMLPSKIKTPTRKVRSGNIDFSPARRFQIMNLRLIGRIMVTTVIVATGAIVAPGTASAAQQAHPACSRVVTTFQLYTNHLYQGKRCNAVDDIPNLKSIGFNDAVSSFANTNKFDGPWCVYADINYRGRWWRVEPLGRANDLKVLRGGWWNDKISSVRRADKDGKC